MEVVAFLTLAVAGFIMNKRRAAHGPVHTGYAVSLGDSTQHASNDLYESRQFEQALRAEADASDRSHTKSMHPEKSGVIPRNYTVSELSGLPVDFTHGNMTPYFGGSVRQSTDPKGSSELLERFTGSVAQGGPLPAPKVEQPPMFAPQPLGDVYGKPSIDLEDAIDHLPVQKFKNNDLPFKQVTVGPAIGGGFTATPGDGYITARQYQMPKDTNELRTLDDPKVSYEGRTIPGAERVKARGELGAVDELRYPQRYKESFSSDDWTKTTGQVLGEASRPEQLLKDVQRPCTHVAYTGSAGPTSLSSATYTGQGDHSDPHRSEGHHLQIGAASAAGEGPTWGDYGRANILVHMNERDTTNVPVYSGSSSTVVKAIIAPLLDMMRPARRQVLGTDAARTFGNMSIAIPNKQTVRDQDGILRTTLRETSQQVHAQPGTLGTLRGPILLPVYDPSDIAKTTLKEQTIHDSTGPFAPAPAEWRTSARDADDRARTTTRQTLDCGSTSVNPSRFSKGQLLRDPELHMRPTVKQTTVASQNAETDGTTVGGLQGWKGGYTSADMTAFPTTAKQFLQEDGHVGTAGTSVISGDDGYRVANLVPRDTQKQVLSQNSYYGGAGGEDAQMSHEDYDHATIRPDKEILSVMGRRDFAPSGTKEAVGLDGVHVGDPRKFTLDIGVDDRAPSVGRIMSQTVDPTAMGSPEVGGNTNEGTRGLRGTYSQDMALPHERFAEDVSAMHIARSSNPTANMSYFGPTLENRAK